MGGYKLLEEKNEVIKDEEILIPEEMEQLVEDYQDEELVETEEVDVEDSKTMKLFKGILAGVMDQIIIIAVALLMLIIFDAVILKLLGYYIAEREPMFLMMYIIVNIIYVPICESLKIGKTIGKKVILK